MRAPLLFLLALLSACSVVNRDHCGNLDGGATCITRDPSRPYCSLCVADHNGCLAEAPADECAVTSGVPGSTGTASSTTDVAPTTSTSTGDASTTSSGDPSTTTISSSTSTGTDSTGTTASGPECGDNVQEGEEVCDGDDLADQTCAKLLPDKWGGGKLGCNNCASYNDSECCIGVGQKCDTFKPEEACCGGLKCTMDALPSVDYHCQQDP